MTVLLLPTREIMRELSMFDSLFSFYENGMRSVIEESILATNNDEQFLSAMDIPYNSDSIHALGNVVQAYETFIEEAIRDNTYSLALVENYAERINAIKLAVGLIDETVHRMMMHLLKSTHYRVMPEAIRWLGDDLIIKIVFVA